MKIRERRSFFVLLSLLATYGAVRSIIPYIEQRPVPLHWIAVPKHPSPQKAPVVRATTRKKRKKVSSKRKKRVPIGIDINKASITELQSIPGIGPKRAAWIVRRREELGGYATIDELQYIYSMDSALVQTIKPYLQAKLTHTPFLDLNQSTYKALIRHPYLSKPQVKWILRSRTLFSSLTFEDLSLSSTFGPDDLTRLKPHLLCTHRTKE